MKKRGISCEQKTQNRFSLSRLIRCSLLVFSSQRCIRTSQSQCDARRQLNCEGLHHNLSKSYIQRNATSDSRKLSVTRGHGHRCLIMALVGAIEGASCANTTAYMIENVQIQYALWWCKLFLNPCLRASWASVPFPRTVKA